MKGRCNRTPVLLIWSSLPAQNMMHVDEQIVAYGTGPQPCVEVSVPLPSGFCERIDLHYKFLYDLSVKRFHASLEAEFRNCFAGRQNLGHDKPSGRSSSFGRLLGGAVPGQRHV